MNTDPRLLDHDLLWRTIPSGTRAVLESLGAKLNVSGPTLAAAVLAWDAIAKLPKSEQNKAIAVLMGLAGWVAKP